MKFTLYRIDPEYCDYLRAHDEKVPINHGDKKRRPFIGVVLEVNQFKYFAPLTSPKPKHQTMNNAIDFIKIAGGTLGAININYMIPVPEQCLTAADLAIRDEDTEATVKYKRMMHQQIDWCKRNRPTITNRAEKLYRLITSGKATDKLRLRCCDYATDELYCLAYRDGIKDIDFQRAVNLFLADAQAAVEREVYATMQDVFGKDE